MGWLIDWWGGDLWLLLVGHLADLFRGIDWLIDWLIGW